VQHRWGSPGAAASPASPAIVVGPDYPLTATMGQDVVLRCYLSPRQDARSLEVRWIRDNISETVHHYRNGQDLYGEQMGAYAGRTELVRDGLSAGSLDLRITRLRPSDDGRYICIVKDADAYDKATVDLEMSVKPQPWALPSATGTDPHLSLGGYEARGVWVLCRSAGWYPLPQLLWRDARGQHLPSVSQTHSQDQEGLFEIEGAVIVTGSVEGPLSCVVRSSRLQQERDSSLHISGTNGTARVRSTLSQQPPSMGTASAPGFSPPRPCPQSEGQWGQGLLRVFLPAAGGELGCCQQGPGPLQPLGSALPRTPGLGHKPCWHPWVSPCL
uniref:Ig-like domain-containing protein n=1 Tax=Anas platyrhynchos platyrhynchos TaxID=8840 RepID=A0A493TNH0_ANAPP